MEPVREQVIISHGGFRASTMALLSEGYFLAGRSEDAMKLASHALEAACSDDLRPSQAQAFRLLGDISAHCHPYDVEQTETHYQQALALAEELGMRPLQSHCHRGLGKLYSQTGKVEQARTELSMAIEMYRDMEMTCWLPETEAALAQVEGKA